MSRVVGQGSRIAGATLVTLRRAGLASVGYHDVALLDQIAGAARVEGPTAEVRRKAVLDALEASALFSKTLAPPMVGCRQERRFTIRGRTDPDRAAPELPLDA